MINIDWNTFLFRASGNGHIVSKSGKVTDGIMTHLSDVFVAETEGVRKEAYGKALEKGILCEEDGFAMLNYVFYPNTFVAKEKEPKQNEWCKGTADTVPDDYVNDIKNAYDLYSFGKAQLSWLYEWQLRTYMMLYDKPKARLFYCLNNMPEYMVLEEQRKMFYTQKKWATMESPEYLKACDELARAHNYDHKPIEEKFKFWEIERDEQKENQLIEAVKSCREILTVMQIERNAQIEKNRFIIQHEKSRLII